MTSVHNHLEVVLPLNDFRDDAMLTTAANEALERNITVPEALEAAPNRIRRRPHPDGRLAYGMERAAAETAVAGLTGVRNVRDDIDISYDADPVDVDFPGLPGGARAIRAGRRRQRREDGPRGKAS